MAQSVSSVRRQGLPEKIEPHLPSDHASLRGIVNSHADRLGTGRLPMTHSPVIMTGHQAYLYHPGILAKDLFLREAMRAGASALHVVVDQDAHDVWHLDIPSIEDGRVSTRHLKIAGHEPPEVPTGLREAITVEHLPKEVLTDRDLSLSGNSSAEQMTSVLAQLRWQGENPLPVLFVSDLVNLPSYQELVERLTQEAPKAVSTYNQAVLSHPDAGMGLMELNRQWAELPLWAVRKGSRRQRVYADIGDSRHELVFGDGSPIDRKVWQLWPRALMLTAYIRSRLCDLFIHGTGGHAYDRITERWWSLWQGKTLSPQALVTADAYLDLDVPVSDAADLNHAVWWRHHLPHNLDRHVAPDHALAQEKIRLLHEMSGADQLARKRAFRRIHEINHLLANAYPDAIHEAEQQLEMTRIGIENRRTLRRRDWFFGLYPAETLESIADQLRPDAERIARVPSML